MSLSGGRSYRMSGSGKEACRKFGSGQDTLTDIREWSGDSPGCPGVVRSLSQMSGVVRSPSRMSWSSRETLPDVREWWKALTDNREW